MSLLSSLPVPASLPLSAPSTAVAQPSVPSPALALTGLLSPLIPGLEGPSRKACGCPQSPGVQAPHTGRPQPRPPPALRSSFAWPWSCPLRSRRSGSAWGSRRRKTYSGSCSSRSPSTEPPPSGGHLGCSPPTFVIYLFINTQLLGSGAWSPRRGELALRPRWK